MSKHFTFSLMGMLLVVFAAYILLAGSPLSRITHTCAPITWVGKAVSAAGGIFSDGLAGTLTRGAANTTQGCRYIVFKTFYADEFARAKAAAAARQAAASKPAVSSTSATPAADTVAQAKAAQ